MVPAISFFLLLLGLVVLRIRQVLPSATRRRPLRSKLNTCSLAVFLGSGGHTREALMLVSSLDFTRYSPRTYVISEGDDLSAQKAIALEAMKTADPSPGTRRDKIGRYTLLTIPRARRVHQPLLTTPPTALLSIVACVYHVTLIPLLSWPPSRSPFAEVLILNGPGTCFALCVAVLINKVLGLPSPKLIYVESFARVRSLSLSGRLLRPLVDRFIVQWPELLRDGGRGHCHGFPVRLILNCTSDATNSYTAELQAFLRALRTQSFYQTS